MPFTEIAHTFFSFPSLPLQNLLYEIFCHFVLLLYKMQFRLTYMRTPYQYSSTTRSPRVAADYVVAVGPPAEDEEVAEHHEGQVQSYQFPRLLCLALTLLLMMIL